jgi:hypothetical protein
MWQTLKRWEMHAELWFWKLKGRGQLWNLVSSVSTLLKDRQCKYKVKRETPSCNRGCLGKSINITFSESVFLALGILHSIRMRHTVICGLPGSTIYFATLCHKRKAFRKSYITQCVFGFSLQLMRETFVILRRIERHMIINIYWSPCKVLVILVIF